jgi:pyruvate formate lyase activating enzyme
LTTVQVLLRKTSLIDFPPYICAVLFFPGCNLRCPWCHNRELVLGEAADFTGLDKALAHIEKRRGVLGGVVLSGGEPTLYAGLGELIGEIKKLALRVKLDTNGLRPGVLAALFARPWTSPDYIAMDLKLAPDRYWELLPGKTGESGGLKEALKRSAALIRASGIKHEFRSLELPEDYFTGTDRAALAELARDSPWIFRPFISGNCLDPAWDAKA